MPAHATRVWPVEFDETKPIGDWGKLRVGGSWGADAPWRFEPGYWEIGRLFKGREVFRDGSMGYIDEWVFVDRDELREFDLSCRSEAMEWQREEFAELDRAFSPDSPFLKFKVIYYEWES
jgi:hypothetical protein